MQDLCPTLLTAMQVDVSVLRDHLATSPVLKEVGPPDLLVRTSGEKRLSNFLLFELAYCELYFSSTHWCVVYS